MLFLRTLESNGIESYCIIASSPNDTILQTAYLKNVFYTRKNKNLDLDELLMVISLIKKERSVNRMLIVPSTEMLNRFLLKHREVFEKHGCVIPLVNEYLYTQLSDKESFWKLCNCYHLLTPKQTISLDKCCIPFVAKPKKYYIKNGNTLYPVIIQSQNELDKFKLKYETSDFLFQDYIDGLSYYLLFYFSQNGSVYSYSQMNLAQQSGGKSIIAACGSRLHCTHNCTAIY